ncbi:hypothetical protein LZQ00_11225 [Sphingobacterium sp. SRCM116780]|uniref:hypothetical protein n=1 Tax=Sphingobacterium sp. SRCM116780 TaxID=2907623 RepID=UPI001F2A498F|nr:hypothetical protein [Sphingobacterium sp. SRCM116780]UIR54849.1 hypothetical protein LZQ00_11225 [Sphingobacterium sp. SRCM116780]
MMKIISIVFIFLLHYDCTGLQMNVYKKVNKNTVYICGSGKGKRYHLTESCRGLRNCSAQTLKVTLEEARKEGKTLCGWED